MVFKQNSFRTLLGISLLLVGGLLAFPVSASHEQCTGAARGISFRCPAAPGQVVCGSSPNFRCYAGDITEHPTGTTFDCNSCTNRCSSGRFNCDANPDCELDDSRSGDTCDPGGNRQGRYTDDCGTRCEVIARPPVTRAPYGAEDDGETNPSIWINKTAGGNLVQLQSGGADRLILEPSGNLKIVGSDTGGDLYLNDGKAIRVDGARATALNLGNFTAGGTFKLNVFGDIQGNFVASSGSSCAIGQLLQQSATGWGCVDSASISGGNTFDRLTVGSLSTVIESGSSLIYGALSETSGGNVLLFERPARSREDQNPPGSGRVLLMRLNKEGDLVIKGDLASAGDIAANGNLSAQGTIIGNFLASDGSPCTAGQILERATVNGELAWVCGNAGAQLNVDGHGNLFMGSVPLGTAEFVAPLINAGGNIALDHERFLLVNNPRGASRLNIANSYPGQETQLGIWGELRTTGRVGFGSLDISDDSWVGAPSIFIGSSDRSTGTRIGETIGQGAGDISTSRRLTISGEYADPTTVGGVTKCPADTIWVNVDNDSSIDVRECYRPPATENTGRGVIGGDLIVTRSGAFGGYRPDTTWKVTTPSLYVGDGINGTTIGGGSAQVAGDIKTSRNFTVGGDYGNPTTIGGVTDCPVLAGTQSIWIDLNGNGSDDTKECYIAPAAGSHAAVGGLAYIGGPRLSLPFTPGPGEGVLPVGANMAVLDVNALYSGVRLSEANQYLMALRTYSDGGVVTNRFTVNHDGDVQLHNLSASGYIGTSGNANISGQLLVGGSITNVTEALITGNAAYDSLSTSEYLLRLRTFVSGSPTPRFTVDKNGNLVTTGDLTGDDYSIVNGNLVIGGSAILGNRGASDVVVINGGGDVGNNAGGSLILDTHSDSQPSEKLRLDGNEISTDDGGGLFFQWENKGRVTIGGSLRVGDPTGSSEDTKEVFTDKGALRFDNIANKDFETETEGYLIVGANSGSGRGCDTICSNHGLKCYRSYNVNGTLSSWTEDGPTPHPSCDDTATRRICWCTGNTTRGGGASIADD